MENPNYYAIIPANVRYAKIAPNAKLLFWEITALANKNGYCYASNTYFSELYQVRNEQISRWISALEKEKFIYVEIDINNGNSRKIYIWTEIEGIAEKRNRYCAKTQEGIAEKRKYNNTYNTTYNNIESTHTKTENNSIEYLRNTSNTLAQWENIEIPEYAEKYKEDFMDFLLYWTEPDSTWKIRASKEKTFELKRRFYTWMKRKKENFSFVPMIQQQKPNYGWMYRKPWFDD